MARFFYKIGDWSARNNKKVLISSVSVLAALMISLLMLGIDFNEDMSIPGTESEKAMNIVSDEFPSGNDGSEVQLVMKAPDGEKLDDEKNLQVISDLLEKIQQDTAVESAVSPDELENINQDKQIGYSSITYDVPAGGVTEKSKDHILNSLEITRDAGIQTEIAGDVAFSELHIGGSSEIIGVVAAFLILAITLTSFFAAGMPILSALTGLGIGIAMILIGTNYIDIPSFSITLAAMLGLAVGIDYALFIFSRFKQQLKEGFSIQMSIAIANGTAGSAVVFAGITVIVALLGLSIVNIPFLSVMGIAAAVCVLIAVVVAVVVVPALLSVLGHKLSPSKENKWLKRFKGSDKPSKNNWGNFVTKKPILAASFGILLLCIISLPFFHMQLGLPNNGNEPYDSSERKGYDLLSEAYGEGHHATLVVAAKSTDDKVISTETLEDISGQVSEMNAVENITPPIPSESGELSLLTIKPETGPNDKETNELVNEIRDLSTETQADDNVELMVTGATAVNIDISQKLSDAIPLFASFIILFAFVLLVIVFRSILVPLKAVLGFALSLGATLGFSVFIIQDGNFLDLFNIPGATPVLNFLPVIVIGILFGLAMDYEVFLVSRMREEYMKTKDPKLAILRGLKASGGVVTAAGLIMVSVFAGFMFAPDLIIKQMGMALTFGVLFDAFIVRLMIVPAVMTLMGEASWYLPKWLDRILPNLDIEGESLIEDADKEDKLKDM